VAYEFRLPDIGEGLTEAEITEWLIDVGQEVKLDQPFVQIETDKAVSEIPAPQAGILLHQGAPAGSVVKVGDLLAVIGQQGEAWPAERPTSPPTATPPAEADGLLPPDSPPIVGTLAEAEDGRVEEAARALPGVRKLARDLGVDLTTVKGTGPGGRIIRDDVEDAAGEASAGGEPHQISVRDERVRLSRLRRTIAGNMARSWREIPHVTAFDEADASRFLLLRANLAAEPAQPFPLEALFIRAVLPALQAYPQFNATLDGEDLIMKGRYDIGFAVDTSEGLVVAVVKEAGQLELRALADEVVRLAAATRDRTATVQELTGATFTISNIGAVGGGFGTPIIPFGTTAILSFGRAEEKPVVEDGRIEVGTSMPLSLSYDHRVIDGALGRRFLAKVIEAIEDPGMLAPN
jgi:pyruvate dehydrogenase E2 component (dihydrolipoyllysine-residue acetyltransferase)